MFAGLTHRHAKQRNFPDFSSVPETLHRVQRADLWGHVVQGTHTGVGLLLQLVDGQTPVSQPHHTCLSQEQVLGLDVTVYHPLLMHNFKRL